MRQIGSRVRTGWPKSTGISGRIKFWIEPQWPIFELLAQTCCSWGSGPCTVSATISRYKPRLVLRPYQDSKNVIYTYKYFRRTIMYWSITTVLGPASLTYEYTRLDQEDLPSVLRSSGHSDQEYSRWRCKEAIRKMATWRYLQVPVSYFRRLNNYYTF